MIETMRDLLPGIYDDVKDINELISTEDTEFKAVQQSQDDSFVQGFVPTATWGTSRYESIFGLNTNRFNPLTWGALEDSGMTLGDLESYTWAQLETLDILIRPYDERRPLILAKMRGSEITTEQVVRALVKLLTQKDADVIVDHEGYNVSIIFLDNAGVPSGLTDAKRAVSEIIPAHLAFEFKNSVTVLWGDLLHTTCANLAAYTVADIKGGLYNA